MAIPKYNEFFPSFLTAMKDGQVHNFRDVVNACADAFQLTDQERKEKMPSGKNYLSDRVGWARTYLKNAGLLTNIAKGKLQLTDEGIRVANSEPEKVTLEYLSKYDSFRKFYGKEIQFTPGSPNAMPSNLEARESLSPQEQIENAIAEMNKALADELMDEVLKIDCYDFEKLIIKLLVAMGYGSTLNNQNSVTAKSGDEGIDGILTADKFGFDSIYIQAKQWKTSSVIGRPEIQKFGGAMMGQGASKGLFITTTRFSDAAQEYAKKNLASKIVLVDGETLAKLLIEYDIGVSTVETYRVKKVDSDFFADFN
jgi:restriction system protein